MRKPLLDPEVLLDRFLFDLMHLPEFSVHDLKDRVERGLYCEPYDLDAQ